MDIFVNSSRTESFPNALLEAMACGCAPIGSKVGGIPELIDHGRSGLIFESGSVEDLSAQLEQLVTSDSRQPSPSPHAAAERARTRFSMEVRASSSPVSLSGSPKRRGSPPSYPDVGPVFFPPV